MRPAWAPRELRVNSLSLTSRPYETDALFQQHRFWIERYQRQRLRNVLEDVEIQKDRLVRIEQDPWFDVITLRIWCSMRDSTVDRDGAAVAGDSEQPRLFSEYWTFIRRTGVETGGKEGSCPSCGAGIQVSMAGVCESCQTKVTTGAFGWVLALIEQDEAYRG